MDSWQKNRIYKSYHALCQGFPSFLNKKNLDIGSKDFDKFLSGLIRSDSECSVYEHTMLNPQASFMSEQLQFLLGECKKLEMFKNEQDYQVVDEIASKK